jgi:hypothetical protein
MEDSRVDSLTLGREGSMRVSQVFLIAGFAAALAVGPAPAFAQRHGGGGSSHGGAASGHSASGGAAPRQAGGAAPTSTVAHVGGPVHGVVGGPGYVVAPIHFYHPYYVFAPHVSVGFGLWVGYPFPYSYAFYTPFYYPYGYYNPYWYGYGNGYYAPYGNGRCDSVGPNGYPPYGCAQVAQPYGGGIDPADASAASQPSGPQTQTAIGVQTPQQANTGGMSFEITPATAELFVDDVKVGTVGQFTPSTQPLGVKAGHHHVEVRAPGYQIMSFDVEIIAGEVIPYQGVMER